LPLVTACVDPIATRQAQSDLASDCLAANLVLSIDTQTYPGAPRPTAETIAAHEA